MEGQPQRKNPRLKEFDYSTERYYFITICTKNRERCLCRIVGRAFTPAVQANVMLTPLGKIVETDLLALSTFNPSVRIDKYVIMPDHIHFILVLGCIGKETAGVNARPTVPRIVGNFKGGITRKAGRPVWQASFHDHVIRGPQDYTEIWKYIDNNPLQWILDGKA